MVDHVVTPFLTYVLNIFSQFSGAILMLIIFFAEKAH